jgi:hypothetical protein
MPRLAMRFHPLTTLSLSILVGCSSATSNFDESDAGNDAPTSDAPTSDAPTGDAPTSDAPTIDVGAGPKLLFHVRTSTKPFVHTDGLAGQTSTMTKQGIRSLRLLRKAGDPAPVVAFDHGKDFVEAGYDAGDDTLVGEAYASALPKDTFTFAQIVVTHSRFRVTSTMHASGLALPGTFDCVETLTDGVTLDGVTHDAGWYRYVFETGGSSYPQEGMGAILPSSSENGGFTMKSSPGETYYEVPIDLAVDPTLGHDVKVVVEVNMDHAFRWEDQALPGYAKDVYDTTPTSYEPVRHFGANSFVVSYE